MNNRVSKGKRESRQIIQVWNDFFFAKKVCKTCDSGTEAVRLHLHATWSWCIFSSLIFLGRLAVGCCFWMTGVSVDSSCSLLVVRCRVSSADCFVWRVYLSMVVANSWLSAVGCRVLIVLIHGCICRWWLSVHCYRVSVVECCLFGLTGTGICRW